MADEDERKAQKKQRYKDIIAEKKLQNFMIEHFYSIVTGGAEIEIVETPPKNKKSRKCVVQKPKVIGGATVKITNYEQNKGRQLRGIDLAVGYPNDENKETMNVDVKASLHHLNERLQTFTMEILSNRKNEVDKQHTIPTVGWFISEEEDTTDYLFLWPRSIKLFPKEELHNLTEEDIYFVETIRVKRDDLKNYVLEQSKKTSDDLLNLAYRIRDCVRNATCNSDKELSNKIRPGKNERYYYDFFDCPFVPGKKTDICYSHGYGEKPVNIMIEKEVLRYYAKTSYLITSKPKHICKYLKGIEVIQEKFCEKCGQKCKEIKNCCVFYEVNKSELEGLVEGVQYSFPESSKFVVLMDSVWRIVR